jgi:CubicO group peptidase (beta-lactamase class C family)
MVDAYVPEPHPAWEFVRPDEAGFDPKRLIEAVAYAEGRELSWPRDVGRLITRFERPPYNRLLGPTRERGPASGLVVRAGRLVARWGEPERVDMTFSAAKSYLAILAGVAFDRGLLPDLDEPVGVRVHDGGFEAGRNARITWQHLLQQTSEWEGTLFGIPDVVDHHRSVGNEGAPAKGTKRELCEPGTFWEYNDVRVNRLALALLHVFGEALPDVLRREVMDPIGASQLWEWHGYENAQVDVAGRLLRSVPGGAHWGGGIFISSHDHARVGLLMLRRGAWGSRQILSADWLVRTTTPCSVNPIYGYMWWLNTRRILYPAASESAFAAQGAGGNVILVEPEHDLVVVTRWAEDPPGIVERVIRALA